MTRTFEQTSLPDISDLRVAFELARMAVDTTVRSPLYNPDADPDTCNALSAQMQETFDRVISATEALADQAPKEALSILLSTAEQFGLRWPPAPHIPQDHYLQQALVAEESIVALTERHGIERSSPLYRMAWKASPA